MEIEIVGPEILVGLPLGEEMVDDDQDAVGYRDRRPLLALARQQAPKLRAQIGVLGTAGGLGRLDERGA